MLKKNLYPFFRLSARWVDPRHIPITKRDVRSKNLENKIPKLYFPLNRHYGFFLNTAKVYVKDMLRYGKSYSTYRGRYLVIYIFSPQGAWEILAAKQKSFIKGPLWGRARRLLGNGLLVSENPDHFVFRRMTMSSFDHKKLLSMSNIMFNITKNKIDELKNNKKQIEIRSEINSLALDIVSKCVFGIDVQHNSELIKDELTVSVNAMDRTQNPSLTRFENMNIPYFKNFVNSTVFMYEFVEKMYEDKIKSNLGGDDLLSIYINSTDEDGNKMSKHQILDEMLTVILAGFESTSNTLVWALAYLNKHPKEYNRLIEESKSIFNSGLSEEEILQRIISAPVCSSILKETLRLCPPIWNLPRMAKEDVEVDGNFIPKGSFVIVNPYVTHRIPEIYPNPEKFIPSRWDGDFEKNLPLGAYFPFSEGNRKCIGDQFAMIEMKIILLAMSNSFKIKTYGKFPRGIDRVTYRVAKPLRAKIKNH
jgi:cytochrome P450